MSGVKCVSCGSIGAIQLACSRCKDITYCKVCEPELESERIEQRLCEICYQNIIQDNERREFEEKIITVYEERTRLFEKRKKEQPEEISALEESIRMIRPSDNLEIVVLFTVLGIILYLIKILIPTIQINWLQNMCLILVLYSIYAYFEGLFKGRQNKAEKLVELNQIKSNKLFSDYSKKETEEWTYNEVFFHLYKEKWGWIDDDEECISEFEKYGDEILRMTIKKVIKSLQ